MSGPSQDMNVMEKNGTSGVEDINATIGINEDGQNANVAAGKSTR